jgi:flagellar biosynthesis protein FlhB
MPKSDKTEPATAKKKRDSRQKGQVAKSQDLTAWTSLLVGLYLIPMTVGRMADVFNGSLNDVRAMTTVPEPDATVRLVGVGLRDGFLAAAPMMLVVMLVSVVTSLAQTGLILSGKALKPDFKRVSPKQGIQRLFSVRSAWETGKQLLKMMIVFAIGWPRGDVGRSWSAGVFRCAACRWCERAWTRSGDHLDGVSAVTRRLRLSALPEHPRHAHDQTGGARRAQTG